MRGCRRRARVPSGSSGATTATTLPSCRTCSVTTPAWTSPSSCHHCTALLLISLFSLASFITSPTHFTVALDDVDLLHESEREGGDGRRFRAFDLRRRRRREVRWSSKGAGERRAATPKPARVLLLCSCLRVRSANGLEERPRIK